MKIYPSLISADLLNLRQVIKLLDNHCDGYHLDVMDDHFVPNLTFGPDIINAIAALTQKPLHVHLMVDNPEKWPERLKLRGGDTVIVHYESFINTRIAQQDIRENIQESNDQEGSSVLFDRYFDKYKKLCEEICKKNWQVGLALNPENILEYNKNRELLVRLFAHVNMVLCMTVHPGFAGQKLMPDVLAKVKDIALLSPKISIWVDGGVSWEYIRQIGEFGATGVAVASAIFAQNDPIEALKKLYLVAGNTR